MQKKTVKAWVEEVLRSSDRVRNSDVLLVLAVWYKNCKSLLFKDSDGDWCIKLKNIFNLPRASHIERIRRKFNENKLYLPTDPKVREARNISEQDWREWSRNN